MPAPAITPSPNPDHFGGAPVRTKRPAIVCRAGYVSPISAVLRDQTTGAPINLTAFDLIDNQAENSAVPRLRVTLREYTNSGASLPIACATQTAAQGQVTFTIPAYPAGVYAAEFFVEGVAPRYVTDALVWVEPSNLCHSPLPTRADLRTELRDFAGENELLDAVDFDDTELATTLCRVVDAWNTLPPRSAPKYDTTSFPYRSWWLRGAIINLFEIAAEHYVRNSLPYQARGGLSGDDKAKFPPYLQRALGLRQSWQAEMAEQKLLNSIEDAGSYVSDGLMW